MPGTHTATDEKVQRPAPAGTARHDADNAAWGAPARAFGVARAIRALVDVVYPPQCIICGTRIDATGGMCGACWRETPFITGLICDLCGAPLPGSDPGHPVHCDECLHTPRPWRHGRAAMLYRDNAKRLILPLKHADRTQLARPAALWMARAAGRLLTSQTVVVPVPVHWSRLLSRRYSQSALLAQELARLAGATSALDALLRTRRTPMLDGAGRAERHALLDGAIAPHPRRSAVLRNRAVLVVDDVMTTGATLAASTRAALEAGAAEVSVLVLARVARDV